MSRPLRVGFVLHVMQVAGAEVLVREMARRLAGRVTPTVFCLDAVGRIGEELLAEGVEVVCLGRRPGRDWGVGRRLAVAVAERRIDVVHAHQYTPFFYAAVAKLIGPRRPRVILTEHGRHYPDLVPPVRRTVNRLLLDRLADAVTACCRFSARGLARNDGFAGRRVEVIRNGIAVERYGPAADKPGLKRRLGLDPARRYVVHVARHHPVKDQATLLRGFAAAAAGLPDVDLLMAGDGPLRGELEALAGTLGVRGRVQFLGVRADVPDLMRAADVFALTSLSEAASLTLLEAMASALPSVVTDVGGNGEIVRHGREGLLVPRGDAAGCGAAFRRLLGDRDLCDRLGWTARKRVTDCYRLDETVEQYWQLYCRVAGRGAG